MELKCNVRPTALQESSADQVDCFLKPDAYITHNATLRHFLLHAASSLRPANTL